MTVSDTSVLLSLQKNKHVKLSYCVTTVEIPDIP